MLNINVGNITFLSHQIFRKYIVHIMVYQIILFGDLRGVTFLISGISNDTWDICLT